MSLIPIAEFLYDNTLMPSLWLSDEYECPYDKPMAYIHGMDSSSCTCEPHCSWHKCRLLEAPEKCLAGTRSVWLWDRQGNYWVAQEMKG